MVLMILSDVIRPIKVVVGQKVKSTSLYRNGAE